MTRRGRGGERGMGSMEKVVRERRGEVTGRWKGVKYV